MSLPTIIQGGMGVGVSDWKLARAVSMSGQLGVVSGTAIEAVMIRRLQMGDVGGHIRRALDKFPVPRIASEIYERFFVPGGIDSKQMFRSAPLIKAELNDDLAKLIVVGNFVEVTLAKEGHSGLVGVNLLEKVQMPILPSLYGAMLAGVDYVLMGAGIPKEIPGVLDRFSSGEPADYKLYVRGAGANVDVRSRFMPEIVFGSEVVMLKRPKFLPIISSAVLAHSLAKKSSGKVDGFVIELSTAGGHNAPPRGKYQFNERGEPIYGPRDEVDFESIKELGLPFWLAGSFGNAEGLKRARELGAQGIQVGTAFALCDESGIDQKIKSEILDLVSKDQVDVFTDPKASPTGFPFKVLKLANSLSETETYEHRKRICDLGYLRELVQTEDGQVIYRCPSEPIDSFVKKGGSKEEAAGRKCLCNGLMANIGLGQRRTDGSSELPLITIGDDVKSVTCYISAGSHSYSAKDVIERLLSK